MDGFILSNGLIGNVPNPANPGIGRGAIPLVGCGLVN